MSGAVASSESKSRWYIPVIGLAVSAIFIWLIASRLSAGQIIGALSAAKWEAVPLGLAALAAGYSVRITRWWCMLRIAAPRLAWSSCASVFLMSTAANNVLPLRAGDVARIFAFRGRPGLEPSRVAGTLIIERLLDLLVLLAIFAAVLPLLPDGSVLATLRTPAAWAALAAGGVVLVLFALPFFERSVLRELEARTPEGSILRRLLRAVATLSQTIASLGSPRTLFLLIVLSVIAWAFEGGVYLIAARALELPGGATVAIFALAVATLSTLLPSSPGYVGTFHFFCMQAAMIFGASDAGAAAFAVLAHLMLWLPTTLAGAAAAVRAYLIGRRNTLPLGSSTTLLSSPECGKSIDARKIL